MPNEDKIEEEAVISETDLKRAQQMLSELRQKRIDSCAQEIDGALKRWNCTLDISIVVGAKGNTPQVQIIALD